MASFEGTLTTVLEEPPQPSFNSIAHGAVLRFGNGLQSAVQLRVKGEGPNGLVPVQLGFLHDSKPYTPTSSPGCGWL